MTPSGLLWFSFLAILAASLPAVFRFWQQESSRTAKILLSLLWLSGIGLLMLAALALTLPNLDQFVTRLFQPLAHKIGLI
ncbi:hypothetical protein [Carboxydocella sp. JDF658]|uniref:hypothetical protein n=1 Tax=Carboxydocella sp. JDF658 TaxID=1926600 RepID=UPI0009AEE3F5|nr:hypothetical protein [Carboxydocella sp. JDF658]GAW30506.1 hypothetical protein JDF658_02710 [Carboxydocella sp. JDF658]